MNTYPTWVYARRWEEWGDTPMQDRFDLLDDLSATHIGMIDYVLLRDQVRNKLNEMSKLEKMIHNIKETV